ncbi:MAG: SurA N-terminal domain-containing protein [Xanthobacteraceae bacterium]|nr:SurA N-terminal domain-containing protein [Xanthobacteraceae bacterium]MBX3534139.1 SurA N-terminal domain-containing protein [Xanthobacteraceae bacterium]MCW5678676.1 SurA N-terminal domain-containing protein [Xanthobacteraceae bacterium]
MPRINPTRLQIIFAAAALLFAAAASLPTPAKAQVVALVNGEPITVLDVAERLKLHRGSGKTVSKKEVLEELVEYKLKLQIAERGGVSLTNSEVDRAYGSIAARSGRTLEQFEQALRQGGIDPNRLKARVKADLAWQKYIQANSANVIVRDADLVAAMNQRGQTLHLKSIQYTMQQVIFVVRRNAPVTVKQARLKEAESLRSRVTSCSQVQQLAHEYKEVVVKTPLRRFSSDLSPALQKLLETLPDGRMTPPEVTVNGIEVVAICDRKEVPADVSSNRELRNELLGQRVQNYEKRILDKMRQTSIIRYIGEP